MYFEKRLLLSSTGFVSALQADHLCFTPFSWGGAQAKKSQASSQGFNDFKNLSFAGF
jgi:hypothetical protein